MVSVEYLRRCRYGIRRGDGNPEQDEEIISIIEQCRADMAAKGVPAERANDESDALIQGAIRSYLRWHFPLHSEDAALDRDNYLDLAEQLRKDCWPKP